LLPECTITRYFKTPPHPLGASIVAPSALNTSRFRSVLYVPYFQCRLLATVTVTNVVQGKRSQRRKFTGPPPNQKSWLRQCHAGRLKSDVREGDCPRRWPHGLPQQPFNCLPMVIVSIRHYSSSVFVCVCRSRKSQFCQNCWTHRDAFGGFDLSIVQCVVRKLGYL